MIRRTIALALALLVATPVASADYRYNPYTGKLDYYESAGDPPDLSSYLTSATAASTYAPISEPLSLHLTDVPATLAPYAKLDGTNTPFTGNIRIDKENANPTFTLRGYNGAPFFNGRASGGTIATPTATPADTRLFNLGGGGYDGTDFTASKAQIRMLSAEEFSTTEQGTYIDFWTTPIGSTTIAKRMTIGNDGKIVVVGDIEANALITTDGTSSDFVKGDGSLDDTTYLTSADVSGKADINGTNQPFTGNLNISKADPEMRLTDTGNDEYTRLTKSDTLNEASRKNRVLEPQSTSYSTNLSGVAAASFTQANVYNNVLKNNTHSISLWLKPDSLANSPIVLCVNTGNNYFFIQIASDGKVYWGYGANSRTYPAGTISTGSWQHLVIVKSGATTGDLFINNVKQTTYTGNIGSTSAASAGFIVGKYVNAGYEFDGRFDELLLFNRALTDGEVGDLYNSGDGLYTLVDGTFSSSGATIGTNLGAGYHFDNDALDLVGTYNLTAGASVAYDVEDYAVEASAPIEREVNVWSSKDGNFAFERGIQTFGDSEGTTIIDGDNTYFKSGSTVRASFDSSGNFSADSGVLFVDAVNNRIGINTTAPAVLIQAKSEGTSANALFNIISTGTGTSTGYSGIQFGNTLGDNRWSVGIGGGGETAYTVSDKFYIYNTVANKMRLVIEPAGDIIIPFDSQKLWFGTGKDASINYDGTNLIIKPDEVGAGWVKVPTRGYFYRTNTDGALSVGRYDTTPTALDELGSIEFTLDSGAGIGSYGQITGGYGGANNGFIKFKTKGSDGVVRDRVTINASGELKMLSDSQKILFGTGEDASILYNGTDLIINPREVGTGVLSVSGGIKANGAAGTLARGITFGDADTGIWEESDDNLRFSTAGATRMIIDSAGLVGIGTTSPTEALHVVGNTLVNGNITCIGSNRVFGIDGTTNAYLDIDRGATNYLAATRYKTDGTNDWWAGLADSDIYGDGTNYFIGTSSSTEAGARLVILTSGNVGIGEVAPQDKLEVNGTGLFKDKLKFTQDDGNEYIDSLADGYLDLGATTGIRLKADTTLDADMDLVLSGTGYVDSPSYKAGGTSPVADGTYVMGIGTATNGTITVKGGIITAVTECTNA